jgi:hypothetical protein
VEIVLLIQHFPGIGAHPTPLLNDLRSGHCLPCCHDIDNVFITVQEASLPRCTVRAINVFQSTPGVYSCTSSLTVISYATTDCGVCPSTPRTLATFQELERTRTKEGGREISDTLRLVVIDHRLGHRLVRGRFEARDTFSRLISFTCSSCISRGANCRKDPKCAD